MESICHVFGNTNNVELKIAGAIMEREVINEIESLPNIHYVGNLMPSKAIELELESDVIIALYNPKATWNTITLPNKLFEAMMCGVPIITNIATEIVNETKCGVIVEYDNVEQIRQAILALRDNVELRKRLGNNGRKAFLQKYNWTVMERRLFDIYSELV